MSQSESDFAIEQDWRPYSEEEDAIRRLLFERPQRLLGGSACHECLEGLGVVAERIPDCRRLTDILECATGCRFGAVPGLVPAPIYREIAATPDLEPCTRLHQDPLSRQAKKIGPHISAAQV